LQGNFAVSVTLRGVAGFLFVYLGKQFNLT